MIDLTKPGATVATGARRTPGRRRSGVPRAIAALAGALLLAGLPPAAGATQITLDTSAPALFGQLARLEFVLFDGDFAANNTVTIGPIGGDGSAGALECTLGCSGGPPFLLDDGLGFGQFYQDLTLGSRLSFDLGFSGNYSGSGTPDRLVLSLLDAATNFTLVDTHPDFPSDALPFQDGVLFVDLDGSGRLRPATSSTPNLPVSIPEPGTLPLLALGLALFAGRPLRRSVPAAGRRAPASIDSNPHGRKPAMKSLVAASRRQGAALLLAAACAALPGASALAANHREAPLTALDQKADITDWFAFVSYDDPNKVTMILDVDPLLEAANGPNYHPFDPELLYEMKVDNNFDGDEDVKVVFRFQSETRLPGVFTGFVGAGGGINTPANSPAPLPPGTPLVPPAISALDGPGSEGLSLRQSYTVTIQKKSGSLWQTIFSSGSQKLYAVPGNVGPRTMPDYPALARQGIYHLGNGIKVFAGTVDDPFYIDLGAAFDTLNFRASAFASGVQAVLTNDQDAADHHNFAPDAVAGYNVNAIAIELPITLLTSDGQRHAASEAKAVIGTYGTTSRPRIKAQPTTPGGKPSLSTNFVQIQRMGNPLINELLIGTGDKDKFSMSEPKNDSQFAGYLLDPLLARVINAAYAGGVTIPAPPRLDLLPLVTYRAPICSGCTPAQAGPVADLLRLNTGIAPTAAASRKRLGLLAGDSSGFPNGRRVSDDVTDIAARVVVGVLNPAFDIFPNNRIGDGVNGNDRPYQETFPYVAFANSGRNSRHQNPATSGCAAPIPPFAAQNCPID